MKTGIVKIIFIFLLIFVLTSCIVPKIVPKKTAGNMQEDTATGNDNIEETTNAEYTPEVNAEPIITETSAKEKQTGSATPETTPQQQTAPSEIIPEQQISATVSMPEQDQQTTVTNPEQVISIRDAFAYPGTVECTLSMEGTETRIWIDDENNFASETEAGGTLSYMLYQKPWVYVWSDGIDSGIKFNIDAIGEQQTQSTVSAEEIQEKATEVECAPVATTTKLTLPDSITFIDLSAI